MEEEKIREVYYEGYEDACDLIGEEGLSADTWKKRETAWDNSDAKKNLQPKDSADLSWPKCGERRKSYSDRRKRRW